MQNSSSVKNNVITAERATDFDGRDHFRGANKELSYWLFLVGRAIKDPSSQAAESTQQVSTPVDLTQCLGWIPSTYTAAHNS